MRIKENIMEDCRFYSDALKEHVADVFQSALMILEARRLLAKIKEKSIQLKEVLLTEEEKKEIRDTVNVFDSRMQSMMHFTFDNLEKYQIFGWKELFDDGDDINERNDPSEQ